jgi:hypothetical protein
VPLALSRRRSTRFAATAFGLVMAVSAGACWKQLGSGWWTAREPDVVKLRIGAGAGSDLGAALDGRTGAYLTLRDAASQVEVRLADLPGALYRISTPAGSGLTPLVGGPPGRVSVRLRPSGGDGPDAVTIVLNRGVRWDIRLPAGAGEQHLDLRRGRITRLDLGSAGLLRLRLPRPVGRVPVTLTDGTGTVTLTTPPRTPVRVHLSAGAGTLTTPWRRPATAGRGTVVTTPAWRTGGTGYAVEARAPLGVLSLSTPR